MNYNLIRFIDNYIGGILCFIFSVYSRLTHLFKISKDKVQINKILIIRFWGIGSTILASPSFNAIRERFPKAKVIFLTMARNKGIYDKAELFDAIKYYEFRNLIKVFFDFFKIISFLRKEKIKLAVDFEQFSKFSSIISYLSGAKIRIGFKSKKKYRDMLYTTKVPFDNNIHMTKNFLNITKQLGINNYNTELVKVPVQKDSILYIDKILSQNRIRKKKPIVAININSSNFAIARRWPKENFAKLADMIVGKLKENVVFIGSKADMAEVQSTIDMMKNPALNLAGKTNLEELAALLKKCTVFISNDSGPLHIAAAENTPTISFFGPETPVLYGPIGDQHIIFYKKPSCSPCITVSNSKKATCTSTNAMCMEFITVDEVFNAVNNNNKKRGRT